MPLPALIAAAQEIEIKGVFLEPRARARTLDLKKSPVIETNHIVADQMARRMAPMMVEQGWGRIVQPKRTPSGPSRWNASRKSGSQLTLCWRKADSNSPSHLNEKLREIGFAGLR